MLRRCSAALAVTAALAAAPAAGAASLATGFVDSVYGEDAGTAAVWIDKTLAVDARVVRVNVSWRLVAPAQRPEGFVAGQHGSPGYRWEPIDEQVRRLSARGIRVLLTFGRAPDWAEGPRRPAAAPQGTWRPDPQAVGDFAAAMAARYSGLTPGIPRVRHYMVWNEPNLGSYLTPQWRRGKPASPGHYRRMLAAAARAIKSADPANSVVGGGTAPYGDPEVGGQRMQPARFVRELLCLRGRSLRKGNCARLRLDVFSHHPYSVGAPRRKALNADDVSIPDIHKLRRLLRRARSLGLVDGTRLWVTEVSYDSRPPDPDGVPSARHARWVAETLYLLSRQGVSTVVWLLVRDSAPHPSYAASYQSGMYRRDGRAKRSARAFRFPVVFDVRRGRVWGKSPRAGRLVIERRLRGRWRTVARVQVRAGQVFERRLRGAPPVRARVAGETSLTWR